MEATKENLPIKEKKTPQSTKNKVAHDIRMTRDYTNPAGAIMRIPNKNPQLNYRFIRNTPENISMMEAQGYNIASGDQVRSAGLKPREDGTYRNGDLILGVEPMSHHMEHRGREMELKKRQQETMRNGIKRPIRAGGWNFTETAKEE